MKLLLLLNGYKENLFDAHSLEPNDFKAIKIDDKDLARPKTIIGLMKENDYERVYFGCRELQLQRFQIFMKIYTFLSGRKSEIIDELGNSNSYSFGKLLFMEIPALIFEILMSGLAAVFYHIKYPLDKWIFMKKQQLF